MLKVTGLVSHHHGEVLDSLVLPFSLRQKGRFRITSANGLDVGVFLPRGDILHEGDYLQTECGRVLKVLSVLEGVIEVERSGLTCFLPWGGIAV